MSSRYLEVRPDNIPSDGKVSFKNGFPVLSFTIQSQNGILNPRSIRINGKLQVFKDNQSPPTPVYTNDANKITMDNRLGVYGLMDQLVIRHNRSKQVCEHIRFYNRYLQSYLGVTSSKQDLMGHLSETALIQPNEECMFENVVASGASGDGLNIKKSFSVHLPSGFIQSGNLINLMPTAFGGIQLEIHLCPDSNCLYSRNGNVAGVSEAHYVLSDLSLSCEVGDIPPDAMGQMAAQTEGAMNFQSITSLYTSINTGNAQIQYSLGLRALQSAFMTFAPASNLNTLTENGLATTYPTGTLASGKLAHFKRVQFLKGGQKFPMDFDVTTNAEISGNATNSEGDFITSDPQLARQFAESILPETIQDRTSLSPANLNRNYVMTNTGAANAYKSQPDGGALFGIGVRYSQFGEGKGDFTSQQFGVSLESSITEDNPMSVFIFLKHKTTLEYTANGVQLIS